MTCARVKELMPAVWSGELSEADRAEAPAFRQHLETCVECSAEMASLGGLWERMADIPVPEPSQALHARWHSTLAGLEAAAEVQKPRRRAWSLADFWPRNPVWQVAIAVACLVVGVVVGTNLPRQNQEIAKLHEEITNTREMVALSLLQQESATERLRGVSYTGSLQRMEPQVVSALTDAVEHDASVNVRLAAIDALSKASNSPAVLQSLAQSLPKQDSPMVQAALIDYLVDARDRRAVSTLRQLAAQPDINPAVLERTHFALQQLSNQEHPK
ncbi:MAG TPA: HEAT repeat domain-containing protein [Bryobacteraceae bacterium]|nr:HEAT repeat domain-containing protein [Bryobacteraceae bacterium]